MCEPDTPTSTLRIMTSLFCSASTTASCTHFMAVSKSTISPLRTPRDGACPTPRILTVPSGRPSPTTTQIFEVPISRPTIKSLLAISFLFLVKGLKRHSPPDFARTRGRMRFLRRRRSRCRSCRCMHGLCLQNARGRFGIDRVVDNGGGRFRKRDRNVSLHEQVHRRQLLLRIVAINEELFQPLHLRVHIIAPKRHARVVFVRR